MKNAPSSYSVFTPFIRRFTDEKQVEREDTIALYHRVRARHKGSVWSAPDIVERVSNHIAGITAQFAEHIEYVPLGHALDTCLRQVVTLEKTIVECPEIDWNTAHLSLVEGVDLRRFLRAKEHFLSNEPRVFADLENALGNVFGGILQSIPKIKNDEATFTVPLYNVIPNIPDVVARITGTFFADNILEVGLFTELQNRLYENVCNASGVAPYSNSNKKLIAANESKLPTEELLETYFAGTPFLELLRTPVPFSIPERTRYEHTAIVAGSGWGKTQLLQSIILSDLLRDDPPSLIVLDSTGQMTERIQRLALFNHRLKDRLLIIDPAHSPSLNMFDVSNPRFDSYTPHQKEDIQTDVVALFNYIFASGEYDLSGQMGVAFTYAVRLVLSRPGTTIIDLRHILEETPKTYEQSAFRDDIQRLDPDSQAFFKHHFFSDSLKATRASIARRLHAVLAIPAFRRMFTASANTLDLFSEMQRGTTVLVNTNANLLKEDGMALFGRYVIARALAAAFERTTINEQQRKPAFLIIDEAAPYFDDTFDALLTRVRQFRLGVCIAFQHLEQTGDKLRSAIAANTSIKYAARLGHSDRRWMAHEMETTPEFIQAQQKDSRDPPRWTQFACHALGYTKSAVSLTIPFGVLESEPRMTEAQYSTLLERNKARVAPAPAEVRTSEQQPAVPSPLSRSQPDVTASPQPARSHPASDGPEAGPTW